jgi:hypothetical protein
MARAALAAAALLLTGGVLGLATPAAGAIAGRSSSRLAYSTASNQIVQPQRPRGSCHAIGSALYTRPDPRCTPGALNPAVTQATIGSTICGRGWTATVRPPESVTEAEKRASLVAYGDHLPLSYYEYDHLVPLELGGATNDPRNLWPEPGATPNPKDGLEDELNQKVCAHQMSLASAQRAIAANWVALIRVETPQPTNHPGQSPPAPSRAKCSASARYNSRYGDYDVYVYSNQPDQTVTVSGGGASRSWHTDGSGYADVYFYASRSAAGETLTVRVGAATCSTTL